eukprot:jgi/Mesvir1/29141/Mv18437-RA.3
MEGKAPACGRHTRLFAVVSLFAGILLGLPVWWYTTHVYRAPLPRSDIAAAVLDATKLPWSAPLHIHVAVHLLSPLAEPSKPTDKAPDAHSLRPESRLGWWAAADPSSIARGLQSQLRGLLPRAHSPGSITSASDVHVTAGITTECPLGDSPSCVPFERECPSCVPFERECRQPLERTPSTPPNKSRGLGSEASTCPDPDTGKEACAGAAGGSALMLDAWDDCIHKRYMPHHYYLPPGGAPCPDPGASTSNRSYGARSHFAFVLLVGPAGVDGTCSNAGVAGGDNSATKPCKPFNSTDDGHKKNCTGNRADAGMACEAGQEATPLSIHVGKYRHAWAHVPRDWAQETVTELLLPFLARTASQYLFWQPVGPEVVASASWPEGELQDADLKRDQPDDSSRHAEDASAGTGGQTQVSQEEGGALYPGAPRLSSLPLSSSGDAILSFNLLNANPSDWLYKWDFKEAASMSLDPVLHALAPVARLTVESQVLYYTPMLASAKWSHTHKAHVVPWQQLPFFVNANEWHLDSSVTAGGKSRLLHFCAYIPAKAECPLQIGAQGADGAKGSHAGTLAPTNAFIVSEWGGVAIFNPRECHLANSSDSNARRTGPKEDSKEPRSEADGAALASLSMQEMSGIFSVFVAQLRDLMGLPAAPKQLSVTVALEVSPLRMAATALPVPDAGFAEWEVDMLLRKATVQDASIAVDTLASLVRMARQAVQELKAARAALASGHLDDARAAAVRARRIAEEAFLDPSIMALLYFPSEHKLAVYMPLFFPLSLPIFAGLIKETRHWFKKYKQQRRAMQQTS